MDKYVFYRKINPYKKKIDYNRGNIYNIFPLLNFNS